MAGKNIIRGTLQEDSGYWVVRARVFDPIKGKAVQKSKSTGLRVKDRTKRKAEAKMRDIVKEWEQQESSYKPTDKTLFKDCVLQWLSRKSLDVRPNTLQSYKVLVDAHVIPELGNIPICDITRVTIQGYFEKLQRAGASVSTMKKHRIILQGTLEDAVLDDLIPTNSAEHIRLPRGEKYEGKALSETQAAIVLGNVDSEPEPVKAAILLALVCGMRRSEICGLRWDSVDLPNEIIHIRNTMTSYSGKVYEAETTKTKASRRDLCLTKQITAYLKELKVTQEQSGIYNGMVCVHMNGNTVKPEYITRACERFLYSCGFEGTRLHDLRHTNATILSKRVPIKNVQAYLGHEDVNTTLDIYVHMNEEDGRVTSAAMDSFLSWAGNICSGGCSDSEKEAG